MNDERRQQVARMLEAAHRIMADKAAGLLPRATDAEVIAETFLSWWAEFKKTYDQVRNDRPAHRHGPDCDHGAEGLQRTTGWGLGYHGEVPSIIQFEIWLDERDREQVRAQLKEDTGAAHVWFEDERGTDKDKSAIIKEHERNRPCACHVVGRKHCPRHGKHNKRRPLGN